MATCKRADEPRELCSSSHENRAGTLPPPPDLLASVVETEGATHLVLSLPLAVVVEHPALTRAERNVVGRLLEGRSTAEVAGERGTSPRTIENQIAAVFRKLRVNSRNELAFALRGDLGQPSVAR